LDGNAGYVLTGMMVRKSQEISEEQNQDDLDIIQFIHEYKAKNQYDIHNIPFIKNDDDNKILMKYSDCKILLENIKISNDYRFSLYDMNNSTQSRNYFSKLEEYQIYHKEWESIVKKINLRESGLSELFTNAKDEVGLIETWFLPTVEDKLNKDKNRIEEFRDILSKYIKQYKDNKAKIDKKNIILLFKEETSTVLDIAEDLKASTEEKHSLENKIANLIMKLRNLKDNLDSDRISLEEKDAILNEEINRIEYEELSFEIYGLKEESERLKGESSEVIELIEKKEEDKKALVKRRDIQYCAKINQQYRDASRDVQVWENKRELIKDMEKDRTPERESLGYTLRHHYENEVKVIENQLHNIQEELREIQEKDKNLEKESDNLKIKEIQENSSLSSLDVRISNYDKLEKNFNELYKEDLRRNILNEYEEGSLEIRIKRLKESIEQLGLEIVRLKKTHLENDEKLKTYRRQIQDKINEHATISQKITEIEGKLEDINFKIETRKSIIKHIGFGEERIFHTEEILKEFQRRKDEVQGDKRSIEINLRDLKEEYNKLKSGKVLELPDSIKDALETEGINYVYGMEWLKRNNMSFSENNKIVKNNPFIPYGLILTLRDIERLKANNLGIYTSFPIPIVIRENLEKNFEGEESSIYPGEKVNFYVLFNNNLLDEKELSRILSVKEDEIRNKEESLEIRSNDLKEYEEKYNKIFYQNLTEKDYRDIKNNLASNLRIKDSLENELNSLRENENNLINDQGKLLDTINRSEKELDLLKRKSKDLFELNKEYKEYLILMKDRIQIKDNILKIRADSKSIKEEISKLRRTSDDTLQSRMEHLSKQKDVQEKLQKYLRYNKKELIQKDIEDVEASYEALTKEITSELKDVEDSLSNAYSRFKSQETDLIETSRRLKIKEEEFKNERYDSFIIESIENDISNIETEIRRLGDNSSDLKSKIAVKESQINAELKTLKEKLNKEDLIPKNEIVLTEFKERIIEKKDELKKLKINLNNIINMIAHCDTNLSTLAEYYELPITEEIEFSQEIILMNNDSLDRFRGMMIRDYRQINETINELRNKLSSSIDKQLRNKAFEEDFFSRPLNTLHSLVEEPVEFIEQLMTTIKAYDDLMAKLEVDIALVDKEKERIIQILLVYIGDIHKNLGKIDKNSTIKIREKPVKMLRIDLPDWEIEENQYRNRLKDMIEDLTQSGINRLENNENVEELISPIITTKNLYNTVVGINNIGIKLYKIEAERQYQIDWAEVSMNSGGEGFLSAFVILSSLLSFMRRDDTDIFAELEEGKVLIMDNPFAQTNAAHLLNPLMDVAKKSNTQLISFTGLSGESIYNSFDNVYVLNLVPSNLRKGMQYLKSQHTKGEDIEIMVTSQIRTEEVEQLDFLF
jgi:chromosome segregation ATPase